MVHFLKIKIPYTSGGPSVSNPWKIPSGRSLPFLPPRQVPCLPPRLSIFTFFSVHAEEPAESSLILALIYPTSPTKPHCGHGTDKDLGI